MGDGFQRPFLFLRRLLSDFCWLLVIVWVDLFGNIVCIFAHAICRISCRSGGALHRALFADAEAAGAFASGSGLRSDMITSKSVHLRLPRSRSANSPSIKTKHFTVWLSATRAPCRRRRLRPCWYGRAGGFSLRVFCRRQLPGIGGRFFACLVRGVSAVSSCCLRVLSVLSP